MTTASRSGDPDRSGRRKNIPPGTLAALWTVSNGRCYAPGCPIPVVLEVRPGVFQKNAQVAHVFGVKPGAARFQGALPDEVRDSFQNLLLLCLAHHAEVDSDEDFYPPERLWKWKTEHEGANGEILAPLQFRNPDQAIALLVEIAEPALDRLEHVTDRLERTGQVTAETVAELKAIIAVMSDTGMLGSDEVGQLMFAAEVLTGGSLEETASQLFYAAQVLPDAAEQLENAATRITDHL